VLGREVEAVVMIFHPVEVVGHPPAAPLLVGAENHLFANLDQVERDQDLVDRDQLGPVLAVEVGLALL
jgi:hypothetical protein